MNSDLLTGVIHADEKPVVFTAKRNSFEFCFLTDSVYEIGKSNHPVKILPKDGFIFGKTHSNFPIAIYVGNSPFEIFGSRSIITSAYVETCSNLTDQPVTEFSAILFSGGTLNQVFSARGVRCDYEGEKTIISQIDDSMKHIFSSDGVDMKIVIRSTSSEQHSIHGFSFVNNVVVLSLEFDSPQPIHKLFVHYNRIRDLLSFLTFRDNVGFDRIELLGQHQELNTLITTANVFIRNEELRTKKDIFENICFDDLGDALPALVKLFYANEDREPSKSLGFFAVDDKDHTMTNAKIRAICSALECELSFLPDIKAGENAELDELVALVRDAVKGFRKSHHCLSNDTYNSIFSSIGYWSFPLGEKLCALYHKYRPEMRILNRSSITITDDRIRAFVKYRNDITHGRHRTLDLELAATAYYLGGLVYCCILNRIGLSREKIQELCGNKILT